MTINYPNDRHISIDVIFQSIINQENLLFLCSTGFFFNDDNLPRVYHFLSRLSTRFSSRFPWYLICLVTHMFSITDYKLVYHSFLTLEIFHQLMCVFFLREICQYILTDSFVITICKASLFFDWLSFMTCRTSFPLLIHFTFFFTYQIFFSTTCWHILWSTMSIWSCQVSFSRHHLKFFSFQTIHISTARLFPSNNHRFLPYWNSSKVKQLLESLISAWNQHFSIQQWD